MSVKVGDKVRFIGRSLFLRKGSVGTVTHVFHSDDIVAEFNGSPAAFSEDEIEVITEEDDIMTNTKAQVGDLIRIVNAVVDEPYDNGDIFEVTDLAHWDGDVYGVNPKYDEALYIEEAEYVIHRKAGEEDSELCFDCGEPNDSVCECERSALPQDAVNSPSHYTQGKFEVIDVIEQFTSGYADGFTAHCIGTATKYIARAPYKHDTPLEDLRKAARYLAFAIEHEQRKTDAIK